MICDIRCLNILHRVIQNVVVLLNVILPDVVGNGVVLAPELVGSELLSVPVGESEEHGRAVLDGIENSLVDVTLHVNGSTRKVYGAMENDSREGNCLACVDVTR